MTKEQFIEFCNMKGKEYIDAGDRIIFDYGIDEDVPSFGKPFHSTQEIYNFGPDHQTFKHTDNWCNEFSDLAMLRVLKFTREEIRDILGEEF